MSQIIRNQWKINIIIVSFECSRFFFSASFRFYGSHWGSRGDHKEGDGEQKGCEPSPTTAWSPYWRSLGQTGPAALWANQMTEPDTAQGHTHHFNFIERKKKTFCIMTYSHTLAWKCLFVSVEVLPLKIRFYHKCLVFSLKLPRQKVKEILPKYRMTSEVAIFCRKRVFLWSSNQLKCEYNCQFLKFYHLETQPHKP